MKRSPLTRKTRLRKRNPARAAKRKAECFGPQAALCRRCACVACFSRWLRSEHPDDPAPSSWVTVWAAGRTAEPHHEPSRGAGGTDRDTLPLCREHHTERHSTAAAAFWAKFGVDPEAVKARLREEVARG